MGISVEMSYEALKSARKAAGLTLTELARGICSESYLSLIESGKRSPSKKIRDQIFTRLQIKADEGLGDRLSAAFRVAEMALKIGDLNIAKSAIPGVENPDERKYLEALRFEFEGDLKNALSLLESLAASLDSGLLRTKVSLAFTRISRDLGFTDQAIACGEAELARENSTNSDELESSSLELRAVLSSCYLDKGNSRRALDLANGIELPLGDSWEKVVSLWAKTSALEAIGDFSGALTTSNLAAEICKRIDRPIAEARLKLNALQCRIELEEITAEIFLELNKIKTFFDSKSLKFDLAETLLIESRAKVLISNSLEAESLLQKALVGIGEDPSELKVRILIALSECLISNKSLSRARSYLDLAHRELNKYFEISPTMAASWRQMGLIYSQLGEVAAGFECLLKATEVLGLPAKVVAELSPQS